MPCRRASIMIWSTAAPTPTAPFVMSLYPAAMTNARSNCPDRAANTSNALSGAGADPIRQPVVINRRHPTASKMNEYREPRTVRAPEPYERVMPDSTESPISNAATEAAPSDGNKQDQRSFPRSALRALPWRSATVTWWRAAMAGRRCPVPGRSPIKRTRATAPRRSRSARRARGTHKGERCGSGHAPRNQPVHELPSAEITGGMKPHILVKHVRRHTDSPVSAVVAAT